MYRKKGLQKFHENTYYENYYDFLKKIFSTEISFKFFVAMNCLKSSPMKVLCRQIITDLLHA